MAAPPLCDMKSYRKILGKGDTIHDFCDLERVREKLEYGQEKRYITASIDIHQAATNIYNKINELLVSDNCGITSFDETGLLNFFYGAPKRISQEEPIGTGINYSNPDTHRSLTEGKHLEYQIPYENVPTFIQLLNTVAPAKYIMDHTYLSPFLCALPEKIGLNTVAKAYDRTIINESDECNTKAQALELPTILKKEEGELFYFDTISITGDMTLGWTASEGKSGTIDIYKMIETKTITGLENLTTAIIAFHQAIQPDPSAIYIASNNIINFCYGLDINEFKDLNQYLLALTDLKRMGDLLQVKLATLYGATFISNDRMSILLSTIGYNHRSIRTSKTLTGGQHSDRIVALYNFDVKDTADKLEQYYTGLLKEYNYHINEFLRNIVLNLRDNNSQLVHYYRVCKELLEILQTRFPLNPIITASDPIQSTTGRVPRHYNPHWINKDAVIYRSLYKYIEFLLVIFESLNFIFTRDFTLFQKSANSILYDTTGKSSKEKLDAIRKLFDTNTIPHPNTLFKLVPIEQIVISLNNIYTYINSIYTYINDINKVFEIMSQDLPMPLFGEPIDYYKKTTLKVFKEIQSTPLTTIIGGITYTIAISSNLEKLIDIIVDIESYFTNLIIRYRAPQVGGKRKTKIPLIQSYRKKYGGNEGKPIDIIDFQLPKPSPLMPFGYPDDIVEDVLGKLIIEISNADKEGRIEDSRFLWIIYMQLQLIVQQLNISLPIVGKKAPVERIPNVAMAAEGGKRKTKGNNRKQPIKGGQSKKENAKTKKTTKTDKKK